MSASSDKRHTREFLIACLYDMAAQPMPPDEGDLRVMREAADMLVVTTQSPSAASLLKEREELRGALELYGEHKHNCPVGRYNPSTGGPHDCECGLDAALLRSQGEGKL